MFSNCVKGSFYTLHAVSVRAYLFGCEADDDSLLRWIHVDILAVDSLRHVNSVRVVFYPPEIAISTARIDIRVGSGGKSLYAAISLDVGNNRCREYPVSVDLPLVEHQLPETS